MNRNNFPSLGEEFVRMLSRNDKHNEGEESFQTKKELYSIYFQEAKLRRELDFPIDEDKPSPFRTYQRLDHELAERRKFFSFNGPTLRSRSLPSICDPGLTTNRQQLLTATNREISQTRVASKWQELTQSLQSIKEGKVVDQRSRNTSSGGDSKIDASRPVIRRKSRSDAKRKAPQKWNVTIHRRVPIII